MKHLLFVLLMCAILAGCKDAKDTVLPTEIDGMASIKQDVEKLPKEERELLGGYIMRHTIGAEMSKAFGGTATAGIPDGTTIGAAIEEQRKFIAERKAEEQKQKELKDALQAKREAILKPMREAITVTLVSKKADTQTSMGIVMDEFLVVTFGYKNNTSKDISGVKGYVSVRDLFDDELSGFNISNDKTIPKGESITWTGSRSLKYSLGDNKDSKLAELADDKYKVIWEPEVIVFADGTKLELPKE